MNTDLYLIKEQLMGFLNKVQQLAKEDPIRYDMHLGIPFWQETGKNYLVSLQANVAKFSVHSSMLENKNALIQNEDYNKNIVKKLSGILSQHTQLCLVKSVLLPRDRISCHNLQISLSQIDTILKNINPSNDSDYSPRRP